MENPRRAPNGATGASAARHHTAAACSTVATRLHRPAAMPELMRRQLAPLARAACRKSDAVADRPSIEAVNAALAANIAALAHHLAGEPSSKSGHTLRFRQRGSLAIVVSGPRRGSWHDHEAGVGGDPLGLVAHLLHLPMREAYCWALAWLGEDRPPPAHRPPAPPVAAPEASGTLDLARRLWREGQPVPGTAAETYLNHRGLRWEAGLPLRFHPDCPRSSERLPALLALMTDPLTAEPCGVHRTFLAPDGRGKAPDQAKMMAGHAGIIRLTPDAEVTQGLGLAEGIETSVSVMQRFGWRPVWAAASSGAIGRFPVLPGIEALAIFADPDGPGLAAAEACARRWADAGREACIVRPPGRADFNDLAQEPAE